jgi:hypothetical protein
LGLYVWSGVLWKKRAGKTDLDGNNTPIFNKLHEHKEVGTPRMGGIIIWVSVTATVFFIWLMSILWPSDISTKLNFLSRDQTWVPFGTLLIGSLVGLLDDWLEITRQREKGNGGMPFRQRLAIVLVVGLGLVWWLFYKLEISSVFVPFYGDLFIGYWIIPLFLLVLTALFSSGVIDGLLNCAGIKSRRKSNYEMVQITRLFDLYKGSLASEDADELGDYNFITASNEWKKHSSFSYDTEAIVYAAAAGGSLGRTHYVKGQFTASNLCFVMTPKKDSLYKINLEFYNWYFAAIRKRIVSDLADGTSKLTISKPDLEKYYIDYIPYEMQDEFVKEKINKYDQLKKKLYEVEDDLRNAIFSIV